jgi:glycosyltransferase involved in cell wall biosynthesis
MNTNSMRVLHFITTIELGGAEKQLLTLVEKQVESGLHIHVIYIKGKPDLLFEFEKLGVTVSQCSHMDSLAQIKFLRLYVKNNQISLIHAHLPRAELLSTLALVKVPIVISRHNAEPFFPRAPRLLSKELSRLVCLRARAIIAITDAVKLYLIESGEVKDTKKVTVIRYGINLEKSDQRENSMAIKKKRLKLLSIGRLVEQKDYPTTLNALALLSKSGKEFEYNVIGEGILQSSLSQQSHDLGIAQSISWIGKTNQVIKFLNESNVFILSSRYEGFGLVLLEAMKQGTPILASNCPAIAEVVGKNYLGLFPVGDPTTLAKLLLSCYDSSFLQDLLEQTNNRIHLFDASVMANEMLKVYQNVLC